MSKWVRFDRRYNQPVRPTGNALRALFKWIGLFILFVALNASPLTSPLDGTPRLITTFAFIGYAVYRIWVNVRRPALPSPAPLPMALPTPPPPQCCSIRRLDGRHLQLAGNQGQAAT